MQISVSSTRGNCATCIRNYCVSHLLRFECKLQLFSFFNKLLSDTIADKTLPYSTHNKHFKSEQEYQDEIKSSAQEFSFFLISFCIFIAQVVNLAVVASLSSFSYIFQFK